MFLCKYFSDELSLLIAEGKSIFKQGKDKPCDSELCFYLCF